MLTCDPLRSTGAALVDTSAKANFRALGKRFGKAVQQVAAAIAAAIAAADATELDKALRRTGVATVMVDGMPVTLTRDEVFIAQTPRQGWSVGADADACVALDLNITPQLRRAGIARDVIRRIQEARKSIGLQVTDRVVLRFDAQEQEVRAALDEYAALIADDVLATDIALGEPERTDAVAHIFEDLSLTFWLDKA